VSLPKRIFTYVLAGILILSMCGCAVRAAKRTLPDWVRRVYIPMVENRTYEPGLEELVTNALIEEFSADGRFEVVRKRDADAVVKVVLNRYDEEAASFESDDLESDRLVRLKMGVSLVEPGKEGKPFAATGAILATTKYLADLRETKAELDVDARDRLAETAAIRIVHAVLFETEPVLDDAASSETLKNADAASSETLKDAPPKAQ
jgi:hypothetical protein